ncbi:MAG: hypothetical protein PHH40_00940 [Candidatus Moranbacteria bacterium]|nr:hypothetical protein [Candidatus Moranbacteria bacterium]MDD3964880.1 hypothetical protein [Candidatus Moranbacteria bacterium]
MTMEKNSSPSLATVVSRTTWQASDVTREKEEERKNKELSEAEKQEQFELAKNRLTRSS